MPNLTNYHQGLNYLLDLNGETFVLGNGYWSLIEARTVPPTANTPHGIKYSLTLHDRNNRRILGYDNANGIRYGKNRFNATRRVWDHRHRRNRVEPYVFRNANQLLADFWQDICTLIEENPGYSQ